jgi:hypothetical protein
MTKLQLDLEVAATEPSEASLLSDKQTTINANGDANGDGYYDYC